MQNSFTCKKVHETVKYWIFGILSLFCYICREMRLRSDYSVLLIIPYFYHLLFMRRIFLGLLGVALPLSVMSADFNKMTFEFVDGSTATVPAENLSITTTADALIVSGTDGTLNVPMSRLSKFYFSSGQSGIPFSLPGMTEQSVIVYDVTGVRIGSFASAAEAETSLPDGLYIIKTDGKTRKFVVR